MTSTVARRGFNWLALALLALVPAFIALGVWQVHRLAWKETLIAQVDRATHAAPFPVAGLPQGPLKPLEYRRLSISGTYRAQGVTLVTGTSVLGSGYWVLVPLQPDRGLPVLVNRGFVPAGSRVDQVRRATPSGRVTVTGLLRLTEPGGTFLRANRPADDRWYSRDVVAIAARRGLKVDPRLFIDTQTESPLVAEAPVAGLTVLTFPNNHLAYALTWFALAALSAAGAVVVWRRPS